VFSPVIRGPLWLSSTICGEPMGVLILFRVRVVVGLLLDAGALYLFIYAIPLISNG
jgi:hypothetical protein